MPINARNRAHPSVPHIGELILSGWFAPNGSSNPTSFDKSWMKSVVRNDTGDWTITMLDSLPVFRRLLAAHASGSPPVEGTIIHPGAVDLAAKTVQVLAFANANALATATLAVGHADLTDADGSQTLPFAAALPADAIVVGGKIAVSAGFTDGGVGVFTADLGVNAGDLDAILDGADIASIATVNTPAGVKGAGHFGAITPAVTVLADVDVVDATAGALVATVYYYDPANVPAAVDIDAGDDNLVWVTLVVKTSSLNDGSELA